jgi:polyvinyl alcohol dehydrogenase (cytochrome)
VYYGSWDGYERAVNAASGTLIWSTFIGQTNDANCDPSSVGVASSATVTTSTINGTPTQVVYVGGGDASFYALNAATGAVIWKTALGTSPSTFMWSSPLVANGSVYEGIASFGDCPLIRGGIAQLDPATGAIQKTLYTAPAGCTGATVWGSPTVDPNTGDIYFATGNDSSTNPCSAGELSDAFVQTDSNLNMLGSWQIPAASQIVDGDFGSTPTLFTAVISGVRHQMVGLPNKNGVFYAFDRANISAGPLWHHQVAFKGNNPEAGKSDISSAAWDGSHLFTAGGKGSLAGVTCAATVREVRPASGGFIWSDCLPTGPVLGAVSMAPGVAFIDAGNTVYALAASTGKTLWTYQDTSAGSNFWGSASVSNGVLYVGNQDGNLYAFDT